MNPLLLSAVFDIGKSLIERFLPDPEKKAAAQLELLKMQQTGELAALAATTDLAKAQLSVNEKEAQNASLFVSGWRPAIGWVCALALAYQFILRPLGMFTGQALGYSLPTPPGLDETLWQLLFGMLGLGSLRTFEKVKGKA